MSAQRKPARRRQAPYPREEQVLRDVEFLKQVLKPTGESGLAQATDGPLLVVLSGLPGTGKSYFAGELARLVPIQVLGSDRIRKLLAPKPRYIPGEHARVFAACHLLIEYYLTQGYRVLSDATNLTESSRRPLYRICERLDVPLVLVRLTAPRETVRRRLTERAAKPHPNDYSDADWLIYNNPSLREEPIGRQHFTADSSGGRSPVLADIARLARCQPVGPGYPHPTQAAPGHPSPNGRRVEGDGVGGGRRLRCR